MKIHLVLVVCFLAGCATDSSLVTVQKSEPRCEKLGYISGTGKDEEKAFNDARAKVHELGGNVLVPDSSGATEIGFAHSPNRPTTEYIKYNGTAYLCGKNT